jgi:1-acyl-sn-glycerol-3-phosphate acyltransferase
MEEESWGSYLWYESSLWLSMVGMTLAFSLRTQGQQHVPRYGPALLVSNHQSYIDPILIGVAARRHLWYVARKTLFYHPAAIRFLRSLHSIPIDQEGFAREGIREVLHELEAGRAVVIFPEGERTLTGQMNPLRPGIYLLIKRGGVPVVPIGIAGAYDAYPRWRAYPIPAPLFCPEPGKGTIAVSIGRPISAEHFTKLPRDQVLTELTTELHKMHAQAERLRRKT